MADADLLFKWANEARTWSRSTRSIAREEHDRWMMLNVQTGYPTHCVMMIDTDYGPVGVVRFDMVGKDVMSYRVSITVGSENRGKGIGSQALDHACTLMRENELFAEIRPGNVASRKVFEKCGFEPTHRSSDGFIKYHREPLA